MVYTSSPALISHLKAAAPIRLIEGSVISLKNSCSGSPRDGRERIITRIGGAIIFIEVISEWWCWCLSRLRVIDKIRVVDMLNSCVTNLFRTGGWHKDVLVVHHFDEGRSWVFQYSGYVHRLFMTHSLHG